MIKEKIFEVIATSSKSLVDRKKWLGPEISHLGIKHNGLDDIPIESTLILAALFAKGALDDSELLKLTEVIPSKFNDYADVLTEYNLASECLRSGEYKLTEKGEAACRDIFNNVITRKRLELKHELENIERIYSKKSEL